MCMQDALSHCSDRAKRPHGTDQTMPHSRRTAVNTTDPSTRHHGMVVAPGSVMRQTLPVYYAPARLRRVRAMVADLLIADLLIADSTVADAPVAGSARVRFASLLRGGSRGNRGSYGTVLRFGSGGFG